MFIPQFKTLGQRMPSRNEILEALRNANTADPDTRDSRQLLSILAALPDADPDVLKNSTIREHWLLAYDWRVTARKPYGETIAPDVEQQRAQEVHARMDACGIEDHFGHLFAGLWHGATGLERQWGRDERGGNNVLAFEEVDAIDLKWNPDSPLGYDRYMYASYDSPQATMQAYETAAQIIIAKYNPLRGSQKDYMGGLYRAILLLTILKYWQYYDWASVNEKYGDPPRYIQYPRGSFVKKSTIDAMVTWLKDWGRNNYGAFPEDLLPKLLEFGNQGVAVETFNKFIDEVTSRQAGLILGQDVAFEANKFGTQAQSTEAQEATRTHNWWDLQWFAKIITRQHVMIDYIMNYGYPTTGLFPQFEFVTDEGEDFLRNSQILANIRAADYEPESDEEVSQKVGFKVRKATTPNIPPVDVGL